MYSELHLVGLIESDKKKISSKPFSNWYKIASYQLNYGNKSLLLFYI